MKSETSKGKGEKLIWSFKKSQSPKNIIEVYYLCVKWNTLFNKWKCVNKDIWITISKHLTDFQKQITVQITKCSVKFNQKPWKYTLMIFAAKRSTVCQQLTSTKNLKEMP